MTDNIEECSLEDLVKKGTVKDVTRKLEITSVVLDDENYHDYSLLITAFINGNVKVAKFLIENGFRVYKKTKPHAEKTPLHYALKFADFQLIRTMLEKGASPDITATDSDGKSPLHTAISREEIRVLNILITCVDLNDLNNMHLLHDSIKYHDIRLLKTLLKRGLSPLKKNRDGETAFCIAVKEDHLDVLHLLWESYPNIIEHHPDNDTLLGLLFVAVIMNNVDNIVEILDMGLTIDATILPCTDGWSLFKHFAGFTMLHCAVKYTQPNIVNFLLETHADAICQDAAGSTAFHIALEVKESTERNTECYNMNEEIIDLLFCAIRERYYANPVNVHGISHFHLACTRYETKWIRYYLNHGCPVDDSVHMDSPIYKGFAPLHFAAKYASEREVETLLRKGADIQREAYRRVTPLHVAARESSLTVVKLLIKHGADITRQDRDGNTPVHYAFEAKKYDVVEFLLSVHAIVTANPVDSLGVSHFHMACTRKDLSIVASFLRNGASVNSCVPVDPALEYVRHNDAIDWRGCSPLHFAAAFGRTEIARFLLEQGASIDASDARGSTAFHLACQYTCEKFRELIMCSLSEDTSEETYWDHGLFEDNFIDVEALESEIRACHPRDSSEIREDDEENCPVVDWSANRKDHVGTVALLVDFNCDVNKLDVFGNAPLFYACYFNLKRILNALAGALNCKSVVLMLLVKSFLREMVYRREILVNCIFKNHDVNMEKCYSNGSILHYLCVIREYTDTSRLHTMQSFLNFGADANATDEMMQTPLHLATQAEDVASVKILLEYNANVNCVESRNSATPLHIAATSLCQESIDIIGLLLMKDVDVNAKQSDGRTPLHNLLSKPRDCFKEFRQIFYRFIALKVDVDARDSRGKTPLFMACTIVDCEIVEELLRFGADVTLRDRDGENIYQFVHGQIKTIMKAYQKFRVDVFEMFWVLLIHAVKLGTLRLLEFEKIYQIWRELRELIKPLPSGCQNQDLNELVAKCKEEIKLLRYTKIHNDIALCDLLYYEDHEMTKYCDNEALRDVLKSSSYNETYSCYGYLLKLKYSRGLDRSQLLPVAKHYLAYLTGARLEADCFSENIFRHLNNVEIRGFVRAVASIKCAKATSIVPSPLKVEKDRSKYSRIA